MIALLIVDEFRAEHARSIGTTSACLQTVCVAAA